MWGVLISPYKGDKLPPIPCVFLQDILKITPYTKYGKISL